MTDKQIKENGSEDDKKSILQQIDEWFGRRHRVYFLISGMIIGFMSFWTLDTKIIDPSMRDAYEIALKRSDVKLENVLESNHKIAEENDRLKDSLKIRNEIGILIGTYYIPINIDGSIELYGERFRLVENYIENNNISIQLKIDTCTSYMGCGPNYFTLKIIKGNYVPIIFYKDQFYIKLTKVEDSAITINLYKQFK